MSPPDAMAMYSWPSNWYAIGEACQFVFAWNDHNGLPLYRVGRGERSAVVAEEDEPGRRGERPTP